MVRLPLRVPGIKRPGATITQKAGGNKTGGDDKNVYKTILTGPQEARIDDFSAMSDDRIPAALAAAEHPLVLDEPAAFSRAAKAWARSPVLGMDTEFVRERTYHANLGLVQVSDGQTVWLLDPLTRGAAETIARLLRDERITKLLHSPSEDLEVLRHAFGCLPEPLVDTQLACALLGQPLQLGYHKAVEWLLAVQVDKDLTRSNWCARPLSEAQLRYAALDVCLLPEMWRRLEPELQQLGRLDWLAEDSRRQARRALEPSPPEDAWQRIRGAGRLDGTSLAILQRLAGWRERVAQERNRPRGFIIPDAALLQIARLKATEPDRLESIEGLHRRARERHGKALLGMVRQSLESGARVAPLPSLAPAQRRTLAALRSVVEREARALGVEPAVLASRRELETLVHSGGDEIPERLSGWRLPVVTRRLLQELGVTG